MSATGSTTPKLTYSLLKSKKGHREVTHPIITDDDAAAALRLAEEQLRRARIAGSDADVAAAQATYDEAEQAVRDSVLLLRLRALPRKGDRSFAALKAEHPPTPDDDVRVQEASGNPKDKAVWHTDTFAPALVAACLIEPKITVEQAAEMAEDWNEAEWSGLYLAALNVNQQATNVGGLVFS